MKNWPIIVLSALCLLLGFNTVLHLFNLNRIGQVQDDVYALTQRTAALEKSIALLEPERHRVHTLTGQVAALEIRFGELKEVLEALRIPEPEPESPTPPAPETPNPEPKGEAVPDTNASPPTKPPSP